MTSLPLVKEWTAALRSRDYKPTTGFLRSRDGEFCCLGVLCDIADPDGWELLCDDRSYRHTSEYKTLPRGIQARVGISDAMIGHLIAMNDTHGATFEEISEYIDEHLR